MSVYGMVSKVRLAERRVLALPPQYEGFGVHRPNVLIDVCSSLSRDIAAGQGGPMGAAVHQAGLDEGWDFWPLIGCDVMVGAGQGARSRMAGGN